MTGRPSAISRWGLPRALILAAVLLAPAAGRAQGTISGVVTDPDGNPVAGAKVIVRTLLESHLRFAVSTDKNGKYVLENFNPSRGYQFNVSKDGFRALATNVEVGLARTVAGANLRQDFTLYPIGSTISEEGRLLLMVERSPGQEPYNRGVEALEQGEYRKARSRLERARELDPQLAPLAEALALVYHRLGAHEEALRAADQVLERKPGDPYYLRLRYEALRGLGRRGEAREVLITLARAAADPQIAGLFMNEGIAAARAEDLELAESMLEGALRLEPGMLKARKALAKVMIQLGKHESAVVAAEAVLAAEPADAEMLRVRHQGYAGLGEDERALAALQDLARHDPGPRTSTLLYNRGVAAFNAGDDGTAEKIFQQALAGDPGHLQARVGLAEVYLRQRRFELCLAAVDEILALDAGHPDGLRIAEWARRRMGRK